MKTANLTTAEKVHQALEALLRHNDSVTVNAVAKKAGIARKTIYNNPTLLERIKQVIAVNELKKRGEETIVATKKRTVSQRQGERITSYKKVVDTLKAEKKLLLEENAKLTRLVIDLEQKLTERESTIRNIRDRRVSNIQQKNLEK